MKNEIYVGKAEGNLALGGHHNLKSVHEHFNLLCRRVI